MSSYPALLPALTVDSSSSYSGLYPSLHHNPVDLPPPYNPDVVPLHLQPGAKNADKVVNLALEALKGQMFFDCKVMGEQLKGRLITFIDDGLEAILKLLNGKLPPEFHQRMDLAAKIAPATAPYYLMLQLENLRMTLLLNNEEALKKAHILFQAIPKRESYSQLGKRGYLIDLFQAIFHHVNHDELDALSSFGKAIDYYQFTDGGEERIKEAAAQLLRQLEEDFNMKDRELLKMEALLKTHRFFEATVRRSFFWPYQILGVYQRHAESDQKKWEEWLKKVDEFNRYGNPLNSSFPIGKIYFQAYLCLSEGLGGRIDSKAAISNLRRAASFQNGSAEAQYTLARLYDPEEVEFSHKEIYKHSYSSPFFYKKAAEQGIALAQLKMGVLSEKGYTCQSEGPLYHSPNESEAIEWYKKAMKGEPPLYEAHCRLGEIYAKRDRVQSLKQFLDGLALILKAAEHGIERAKKIIGSDKTQKSYEIVRKALNGDKEAEYQLGWLLDPKNPHGLIDYYVATEENAKIWYEKAAIQGLAEAQWKLAQLGKPKEALVWYAELAKSASQYTTAAMWKVCQHYWEEGENLSIAATYCHAAAENGEHEAQKFEKENAIILAAIKKAETGDAQAQFDVGLYFMLKKGNVAKVWFEKAAAQGHIEAQCELGKLLIKQGKASEAFSYFEEMSKEEDSPKAASATWNLAQLYMEGRGVALDQAKALLLFSNAAKKGCKDAVELMTKNQKAVDYLKAAQEGDAKAQFEMGKLLDPSMKEGSLLTKNEEAALKYYEQAAEQGLDLAKQALVCRYKGLERVPYKDLEKDFQWLKQFALEGDPLCMYGLSQSYFYGIGTEPDLIKAMNWCNRAIDKDNDKALQFSLQNTEQFVVLTKAAQRDAEACYQISQWFDPEYPQVMNIAKNMKQSVLWLEKTLTAKKDHLAALERITSCYAKGMGNVEANPAKAKEYYTQILAAKGVAFEVVEHKKQKKLKEESLVLS